MPMWLRSPPLAIWRGQEADDHTKGTGRAARNALTPVRQDVNHVLNRFLLGYPLELRHFRAGSWRCAASNSPARGRCMLSTFPTLPNP